MTQTNNKPQEVQEALTDIAAATSDSDWEVYHDPSTGQLRFARRDQQRTVPGASPVSEIAATGFAAI